MGRKKALSLAEEYNVSIKYDVCDIADFTFDKNQYDMIALIYMHLYPEERKLYHKRCLSALKAGGTLVMEVFSKKQFGNDSGGPKDLDLLYDIEEVQNDFKLLKIKQAEDLSVYHDESFAHQGDAEIIRFIGQKKENQ